MTANKTTKTIERLASRLEELESQLELDLDETASQFEEHCQHLRQAYHGFPDHLGKLKQDLGIEWHEMKSQLDELEVQLALARMETVEAFQERRERIINALNAMEDTMQKIESAEDNEGLVRYKDFVGRARKLEDKIAALEVYFKLSENHTGKALDREKERVKEVAGNAAKQLRVLEKATAKDLLLIGEGILKASEHVWDFIKAGIFQYEETEDELRRQREMDDQVPD